MPDANTLTVLLALVTSLGALGTAVSARRKNKADAASSITDSAIRLTAAKDQMIEDHENRIDALEQEVGRLKNLNGIYRKFITELGGDPDDLPAHLIGH